MGESLSIYLRMSLEAAVVAVSSTLVTSRSPATFYTRLSIYSLIAMFPGV